MLVGSIWRTDRTLGLRHVFVLLIHLSFESFASTTSTFVDFLFTSFGSRTQTVPCTTRTLVFVIQQTELTNAILHSAPAWTVGPSSIDAFGGIKAALSLRQTLLPYLRKHMDLLASDGQPVMRYDLRPPSPSTFSFHLGNATHVF